ncbi:DUF721 domain-containing protein [bacterium]|nr:DUF721 domain-containing protein [bacterium]
MKRINNSNFELLKDVIKELEFNYNPDSCQNTEKLSEFWVETIGEKIVNFAKFYDFSDDNILTIVCSDSYVSNELYLEKDKLLEKMNKKAQETGIKIEDIKFDYKKWKEKQHE